MFPDKYPACGLGELSLGEGLSESGLFGLCLHYFRQDIQGQNATRASLGAEYQHEGHHNRRFKMKSLTAKS
jgi:hypothetical protein